MVPHIDKNSKDGDINYRSPSSFPIGPNFTRYEHNPILKPDPANDFESAYLYNASAIVVDDKVFLLYRAQNAAKVSTVGLAWSTDGYSFTRHHQPVLYPTEPWETGGGCEDPRITRDPISKLFILTYTAYDTKTARLCVASSEDLLTWQKYPPVVQPDSSWNDIEIDSDGNQLIRQAWSKSGAIFTERHRDGKYYMIWGDSAFHLAVSDDLKIWKPTSNNLAANRFAQGVFAWENRLIEPGPAPIKIDYRDSHSTKNHYVLFYNAATTGGGSFAKNTYSISQMLVDYDDIAKGPVARLEKPFLVPNAANEIEGQVNRVVFTEGLVQFHGKWFLYFGQGDSELGVATCDV
ncbi:hypothetical protein PSN45_003075 [Yamadazyma tenuis]|uniref:Arabinanase/levansucrase/invertase n=1 Tax=Candida tenuis (strain ATCC 10573 / BCRC 21748 / CBS 615 / JCM 9827 / NBRC 10315 / NRRL Y-1498 / VKM Y-70) TaxID=590646 RepID=G3AZH4_CANTC|nr:Arabinanase/levansucrase/invertase [Yamadazyma tenuis ATCC 10573]XP_006684886.1 uncharacterized protein CANTEDRAFT_112958 [Yamadazyma tenuis ATCC 10573]EGV66311.1 Arabinanase/levansucrase/invertase [Yamadazyma tenuis ATCC 10573]EGV66312.1 hypothetical protein CANTEDRAFT_112958 [Yamadazyma tenuis ATCC 10573]WEJ95555.1 hypothetical protein PSN45_003075 [Yamadazyma tenuis]